MYKSLHNMGPEGPSDLHKPKHDGLQHDPPSLEVPATKLGEHVLLLDIELKQMSLLSFITTWGP